MSEITGDSAEYEYLTEAVRLSASTSGMCCEIGTRLGLSAKVIMDAMREYCQDKTLVCIDPYGSILYAARETAPPCRLDYTNEMKNTCMSNLWAYVRDNPVSFIPMCLEDTEFFARYADGVPVYDIEKRKINRYSMVFLDGPHTVKDLIVELEFFLDRMDSGATIVFDDITPDFYDHSVIHEYMLVRDWVFIMSGNKKAVYQKA